MAQLSKDTWKPRDGGEYPYIGLEHIEEGKLRLNGVGNSSSIASNKYYFGKNTFLFGKLRPYFRKVVRPKFRGVCSTDIWVVKSKPNFDLDFLFYLFAWQDFVDLSYSGSSGTRMPRADWNFMKATEWLVPSDIAEQKAIAGVLSALDDKIDLLHRQNQTLEALAQTLFRQWFIEEAEEDWKNKPLKDICIIRNGYAFKSNTYFPSGFRIIRTLNFSNHLVNLEKLIYISEELANNYKSFLLQRFDFLMVMVGASIGDYAIVSSKVLPALQNQNMWCFRAKNGMSQHFLNFALKEIINNNLTSTSGSARQFFRKSIFYEEEIPFPDHKLIEKFDNICSVIFQKIDLNDYQIQTLENLRDLLLPKLMSGEVRVRYGQDH